MKSYGWRLLALLLVIFWLPAGALALTGQNMPSFATYYKDNVSYINSIAGRHLLPLTLETLDLSDNGRTQYFTYSDVLHVTITADSAGIIETCEIRLLFPENAAEGNSLYQDFNTAQLHGLAYIMAMHVSAEPENRYLLGEEIKNALIDNYGAYERQLGSYTISCISVIGEGAVFTFLNNGLTPAQTGEPADETDAQDVPTVEEDEGANLG